MALFESYERRINQVNAVLADYGIASLEEAKKICDDKGIDVAGIVKEYSRYALRTHVGLIRRCCHSYKERLHEGRRCCRGHR